MAGLSGNFSKINLAEVLRMLHGTKQTGILQCGYQGDQGMLMLDEGRIITATAGDTTGPPALYQLILWREADFEFVDAPVPEGAPRNLEAYDTPELITGVARKIDELAAMQQAVPDLDAVMVFLGSETLTNVEATPAELGMLILADGSRNVRQIAQATDTNELEAARVLSRFRLAGALELVDAVVPGVGEVVQEEEEQQQQDEPAPVEDPPAAQPPAAQPPPVPESEPRYWRGRRVN